MHAASGHALDDLIVIDIDLNHRINGDTAVLQCIGLRNGAGEAIEQVAILAIIFLNAFFDHTHDDVIRNQAAVIHDFFCSHAEFRTGLNVCT